MIKYDKLWSLMMQKGIQRSKLRTDKIVIGQTYSNLVKGESLTINTVDKLCAYLQCQPGDILEWIPDSAADQEQKDGD